MVYHCHLCVGLPYATLSEQGPSRLVVENLGDKAYIMLPGRRK